MFLASCETLKQRCETLKQRSERFTQTGAGWVLREWSLADREAVAAFVEAHRTALFKEAFERSVGRLSNEIKIQLREL